MRLSAENQFRGTVTRVDSNCVGGAVSMNVNGTTLTASITKGSICNLDLEPGTPVIAIINDVDVMLGRGRHLPMSARNQFTGRILDIDTGAVNTVVTLRALGGNTVYATLSNRAAERLEIKEGQDVLVVIKASSVMVGLDGDEDDE